MFPCLLTIKVVSVWNKSGTYILPCLFVIGCVCTFNDSQIRPTGYSTNIKTAYIVVFNFNIPSSSQQWELAHMLGSLPWTDTAELQGAQWLVLIG